MQQSEERPFTAWSFQQYIQEGKLMGARCANCGELHLPPRAICPACHGAEMTWQALSGKGRLAAFTAVYIAPTFMVEQGYGRENPYLSAIVQLDEGVKISARLVGFDAASPGDITIGAPLDVVFLPPGEGEDAPAALAFQPAVKRA